MADEARAKRAAALEEKKRKLEELKARRSNRSETPGASLHSAASGGNLDDYIDGLLKVAPPSGGPSVDKSAEAEAVTAPTTEAEAPKPVEPSAEGAAPAALVPVAPPVKKVEVFTISTQTLEEEFPPLSEADEEPVKMPEAAEPEVKEEEAKQSEDVEPPTKALTEEELEKAVQTEPFSNFLNSASKKVERLLGAPLLEDLLVDADYAGETTAKETDGRRVKDGSGFITSRHIYECAKWTATRDVTDIDWSPVHRELFLASYNVPASSTSLSGSAALSAISPKDTPSSSMAPRSGDLQSDGLALVWSLAMPNRPEHIFTCGSPVLTGRFHPTEPHLMVGGCHSGQLVVWDIRAGRLPVQRSSLATAASKGHSHPICAMEVVEGGSGLVTASSDGKLNFWSLSSLRDPAESVLMGGNLSCFAVTPEGNSLVCGDEAGGIHTVLSSAPASSGSSRSSRRPVRALEVGEDERHFGTVTGIATNSSARGKHNQMSKGFLRGAGGLVLTSGVDWTTKLWAPAYTDKPVLNLLSNSYDYMCDVQWSTVHPSLFATASSNGTLGLWNLASSLDEPISGTEGINVDDNGSLNKLKWSADGRRIMVASGNKVHVFGISEEVSRPKGDEDERMMSNLASRGVISV